MTDLLGFSTPLSANRRDLTALRTVIESIRIGDQVTAQFRASGHGVFEVTGRVWTGVADDGLKVGWWDLTSGSTGKPTSEVQAIVVTTPVTALPDESRDDLHEPLLSLSAGDVVSAAFDFAGSGSFTLRGGVKINDLETTWLIASIHIGSTTGEPSSSLRALTIDQKANPTTEAVETAPSASATGTYKLFGV